MGTKVYCVFSPEYFCNVYSTRELAEKAIADCKKKHDEFGDYIYMPEDMTIQEEELDVPLNEFWDESW